MNETIRTDCPKCGMPDQLPMLACAFCHQMVPVPAEQVVGDGKLKVEKIIGWKGLDVVYVQGKVRLQSPAFGIDGPWTPNEWRVARCFRSGRVAGASGHTPEADDINLVPPVRDCQGSHHGCGYYAGRTREHLMGMGYQHYNEQRPAVLVEVQLAGKMYPATNGWRAQKIKPVRIHVPFEMWKVAADLEAEYTDAEVVLGQTIILPQDAVPDWCPKCSAKWDGRGLSCGFCGHTLQG